ncbi:hypothetical protein KKG19_04450 [Patescibacteria group bacterium]|nr:hypothetical protein [Patescibacteria group bacterium]
MVKSACEEALDYWTIGIQYLHMVEMVAKETIEQGNKFVVDSDKEISWEQLISETRWSDHRLVIPLLFDFYHGVEILLKGFLICKSNREKKSHKLSSLLSAFETMYPDHDITRLLAPYITQNQLLEPLLSFCSESAISIDDYYQALKYPESTGGSIYRHMSLKYRGETGIDFFSRLVRDVNQLRREAVLLGMSMCQKT